MPKWVVTTDREYPSPHELPYLDGFKWINLAVDPREFPEEWLTEVIANSPYEIRATRASNNALKAPHQLIRLGLGFIILVWNPFVTTIGSEAGKDAYGAMRDALSRVVEKAADLENPIIEMQSFHDGCQVSFILRHDGVKNGYAAMAKLSGAAIQSKHLIENMKKVGGHPVIIVYEYDDSADRWYPSFAELKDGTFVTDNQKLIAVEELPNGLSMGLVSTRNGPSE